MAATRTLKAKVELDGEKEYKEALSQLNAGNKTLQAEMRLLQAEFKGNADSMEFLTEKGDLLGRMLDQQKAKTAEVQKMVEKAAKAYEEAARAYEESADKDAEAQEEAALALAEADKKLQGYMASLYNAQAAEANLTYEINENNKALENNGEEMVSLGDTVEDLADKFGITIPDGAKKALDSMGSFSAGTVAKMAIAAAAVAAVVKVVKELGELTLQVASEVDDYLTESQITGVSTEMLQAWDYAAPLIDTDAETIKGAMTKITKAMGDAKDGSAETEQKFAALGVSIRNAADGSLRSAEEVFYDVVDALGEMEAGTERDTATMEIFGKTGQELNTIINAGSEALKDYAEEAENVGYILSKDQVAALAAVDDAYQTLQLTIDGVKRQVAADFAPAAEQAMELFANAVQKAGEWLERSGLISNLASILGSLMSILEAVGKTIANLPGLGSAFDALNVTLKAVAYTAALIADSFNVIAGLLPSNWGSGMARTAMGLNISSGQMSNIQQLKYGSGEYATSVYDPTTGRYIGNGYNATGNDNWRGGLTWVGEAGPELVALPAGSQIMSAQDSRNAGSVTIGTIVIDAKSVQEFNDIIEIVRSQEIYARMG